MISGGYCGFHFPVMVKSQDAPSLSKFNWISPVYGPMPWEVTSGSCKFNGRTHFGKRTQSLAATICRTSVEKTQNVSFAGSWCCYLRTCWDVRIIQESRTLIPAAKVIFCTGTHGRIHYRSRFSKWCARHANSWTGINGQDGSYLAEHLISHGYEVHGLIRRSSTGDGFNFRYIENEPYSMSSGEDTG